MKAWGLRALYGRRSLFLSGIRRLGCSVSLRTQSISPANCCSLSSSLFHLWLRYKLVAVATTVLRQWWGRVEALCCTVNKHKCYMRRIKLGNIIEPNVLLLDKPSSSGLSVCKPHKHEIRLQMKRELSGSSAVQFTSITVYAICLHILMSSSFPEAQCCGGSRQSASAEGKWTHVTLCSLHFQV